MGDSLTVKYSRRVATKDRSGDYDTVEIGGDYTFEIDAKEDPFTLYDAAYAKLAEKIEADLMEFEGTRAPRAEPTITPARPIDVADDDGPAPEADDQDEAPTGRGWVEQAIKTETARIQEGINALPGERLSGGGGNKSIDEYGTPSTETIVPNEAVMYQHCRVFEVVAKPASNGNPFIKVRIGKRGENGIPGQYTNARSFDAQVIKQIAAKVDDEYVYKVREGDYVDVWGYFKPWSNNADKFDLELQKIQISTDD